MEQVLLASAMQLMTQLVSQQSMTQQLSHQSLLAAAVSQMEGNADLLGVLVGVAYPDRIAIRRDSSNRCAAFSLHLWPALQRSSCWVRCTT